MLRFRQGNFVVHPEDYEPEPLAIGVERSYY
jgi:hypothetical protein